MTGIDIEKTADKKFLVYASSEFKKSGKFVFETIDEVIKFIKEAYQ